MIRNVLLLIIALSVTACEGMDQYLIADKLPKRLSRDISRPLALGYDQAIFKRGTELPALLIEKYKLPCDLEEFNSRAYFFFGDSYLDHKEIDSLGHWQTCFPDMLQGIPVDVEIHYIVDENEAFSLEVFDATTGVQYGEK